MGFDRNAELHSAYDVRLNSNVSSKYNRAKPTASRRSGTLSLARLFLPFAENRRV